MLPHDVKVAAHSIVLAQSGYRRKTAIRAVGKVEWSDEKGRKGWRSASASLEGSAGVPCAAARERDSAKRARPTHRAVACTESQVPQSPQLR